MFLNKEQIIAAQDRRFAEVDVPEWGGKVRLVSLNADQTLQQEAQLRKREKGDTTINPLTSLLAASIVDADGNRLFTEKELKALGDKNPTVLIRLVNACSKLNNDPDGKGDAKEVSEEEEVGNSEASTAGASPSASA